MNNLNLQGGDGSSEASLQPQPPPTKELVYIGERWIDLNDAQNRDLKHDLLSRQGAAIAIAEMLCPLYHRAGNFEAGRCQKALFFAKEHQGKIWGHRCYSSQRRAVYEAIAQLGAWDATAYDDSNAVLQAMDAALFSLIDPELGLRKAIIAKNSAKDVLSKQYNRDGLSKGDTIATRNLGKNSKLGILVDKQRSNFIFGIQRKELEVAGPFRAGVIILDVTKNMNRMHAALCDVFHYLSEDELTQYSLQVIGARDGIGLARQDFVRALREAMAGDKPLGTLL